MLSSELVHTMRTRAGLSLRALAGAAGLATSTVHRIEQGRLHPTMDTLRRIADATGMRLAVEAETDYAVSLSGLARSMRAAIAAEGDRSVVRMAAELVARFEHAGDEQRRRMIAAEPLGVDERWDAFLASLAEWLAVRANLPVPEWAHGRGRYLDHGWWVTPMRSLHAWEYAGSPASFQTHGVYLHRDSLTNV